MQTLEEISEFFPLTVGSRWTRSRDGGAGITSTATGTQVVFGVSTVGVLDGFDNSTTYFAIAPDGVRQHRLVLAPVPIQGCDTVSVIVNFSSGVVVVPARRAIGATASFSTAFLDAGVCGRSTTGVATTSIIQSSERVSVPAGQFEALKVLLTVTADRVDPQNTTFWLARGIGIVKSIEPDGTVEELVSTNIVRTMPDDMIFLAQPNASLNTSVISNPITIAGTTAAAPVSISGGEYSINGGAFTTQPGSATNSQSIRVRLTSAAQGLTSTSATLTVGGVAANFTATTGIGAPSAPTSVSATQSVGSIVLTFAAPARDGGAAISGYVATCASANGGVTGSKSAGAGVTSIRVDSLTNGATYTCTVAASNAVGVGVASSPSNAVMPIDITPILNLLLGD